MVDETCHINSRLKKKKKEYFSFFKTCFGIAMSSSVEMFDGCTFHCTRNFVIELRHKVYVNNLNLGIHWEQRIVREGQQQLKQNKQNK